MKFQQDYTRYPVYMAILQKLRKMNLTSHTISYSKLQYKIIHLVNHLFYSNELLIIEASTESCSNMKNVLSAYFNLSGLQFSRHEFVISFSHNTPTGLRKGRNIIKQKILQNPKGKLKWWKARHLSKASRLMPCKNVLNSTPTCHMSITDVAINQLKLEWLKLGGI